MKMVIVMVLMLVYLFVAFSTFFSSIYSALRLDMYVYGHIIFLSYSQYTLRTVISVIMIIITSRFSTISFPRTIRLLFLDSFLNHRHALISLAFIAKMYFWVFVQPHQSKKETSKELACKEACTQITYKYYTSTNYIAFVIVVATV